MSTSIAKPFAKPEPNLVAYPLGVSASQAPVQPVALGRPKIRPSFERRIVSRAAGDAFAKLDPRHQIRNPVMFVVEVGSLLTTVLWAAALSGLLAESPGSSWASACGSGSRCCSRTSPKRWPRSGQGAGRDPARLAQRRPGEGPSGPEPRQRLRACSRIVATQGRLGAGRGGRPSSERRRSDRRGRLGRRKRDHGRERSVIRESGGDRSAVTGGTRVLSDWLVCASRPTPGRPSSIG